MKNFSIKATLCTAVLLCTLASCELDQYPPGSIPAERSWEKISDAEYYQRGLLASVRGISGGAHAYVSEVQTDLFNAVVGAAMLTQEHTWTFTNVSFAGDAVYSGNYSSIYDANNILQNIDKIPYTSDADSIKLAAIKGSAYFVRAFAHFNVTLRFAKDYEPETAATTLGIALVKKNDITAKPSRATLQETFDFICADLDSARKYMADEQPLLDINDKIDPVHIFGLNALEALTARVLLHMHDYDGAIEAVENVRDYYPLIDNADEFAEMWTFDEGSEIIFEPYQEKDNERANPYDAFIGYNSTFAAYRAPYLPTKGLIDMYEDADIRRSTYFNDVTIANNTGERELGTLFWKFPGNPDLVKTTNDHYNMTKTFRVAELYLIAAEASYQAGLHSAAKNWLNELREARGATPTEKTGTALWEVIKDEWVLEMVGEGFRLDCLKRWHEGFKRLTPQAFGINMLISQPDYQNLEIKSDNFKFVWEIPSNDLQANTNLEHNWPTGE